MKESASEATRPPALRQHFFWAVLAMLTFFPFTAILHHAVFFRPTCMLNPFGPDYNAEVVMAWLQNDPSPAIGFVAALLVWMIGMYRPGIRLWAAAFIIAFLPLTIWIWDIPFTDRIICSLMHDERTPLRTRHFYLFGIVTLYPLGVVLRKVQVWTSQQPTSGSRPSST